METNRIRRARRIRRNGRLYDLFFIRPKEKVNADKYAARLASISGVSEVMVTEGDYGYIVKTQGETLSHKVELNLSKSSYKRISSYYQYRQ